jgi:serine protease AprX
MRTSIASLSTVSLLLLSLLIPASQSAALIQDPYIPPISAQLETKLSPELRKLVEHKTLSAQELYVRVLIQFRDKSGKKLFSQYKDSRIDYKFDFINFESALAEVPLHLVSHIIQYGSVSYVGLDEEIKALSKGHIENTTGVGSARRQINSKGDSYTVDGKGVGVAVIDSGIEKDHPFFLDRAGNKSRVVVSRDFTGEDRTDDPYGHGTYIASALAGNDKFYADQKYAGVAPNANLINLRVLNKQGIGSVSRLLKALDWVYTNRTNHNIKVVCLSLGTPAQDSYKMSPLCKAVRKLVDAGVVVVASAGNEGQDDKGNKLYGSVHSPGNEPSAITVGATNTHLTDDRSDDVVAKFSSRGPTRSFIKDEEGTKKFDNLIKPDLVAPGQKIVFAKSDENFLASEYDLEFQESEKKDAPKLMRLSGTSVSTPIVAGTAALLFHVNPKLTPNMVKMILMYTAQQIAGFNMLEQGAGQLNVAGAIKLATLIKPDFSSTTTLGAPLLKDKKLPTPESSFEANRFSWSQGLLLNYNYATGVEIISKYQKIYDRGATFELADFTSESLKPSSSSLTSGVLLGDSILTSHGHVLGDGSIFMSSEVLTERGGVLLGDGGAFGDGFLSSGTNPSEASQPFSAVDLD